SDAYRNDQGNPQVRVTTDYRQLPTRVEHGVQIDTETKYVSTASTLRTHPRCCQHWISLGGLRNICRRRGSAQPNQRLVVVFYEYTHRSTTAGGHVRHGRDARSHTTDRCFTTQSGDPVRARTGRTNPTRPPVRPAKRAASPQTRPDRPLYESGY
ncbi:hypothetical protein PO909_024586, partial [Leuciscus waleckii]